MTRATTTPLVRNVFESFFPQQMSKASTRQACLKRRRTSMEVQVAANVQDTDDQDSAEAADAESSLLSHKKMLGTFKSRDGKIVWLGEPIRVDSSGDFYRAVELDSEVIEVNDYVLIESADPTVPLQIVKIIFMWENKLRIKMCHATWLWRGSDTVLGDTASDRELFLVDDCQDVPMSYIKSKTKVVHRPTPDNWADLGNVYVDASIDDSREDATSFFCQKRYDPKAARFEDPAPDVESTVDTEYRFCAACKRTADETRVRPQVFEELEKRGSREFLFGMIKLKDEELRVGSAVYLQPKTFARPPPPPQSTSPKVAKMSKQQVDEHRYPEYYRKFSDRHKLSKLDTPEPFDIGYITSIHATTNVKSLVPRRSYVTVKRMYRPENTCKSERSRQRSDINLVYWSEEEITVPLASVVRKCYLAYSENIDNIEAWSTAGPNRFYFAQMYINKDKEFDDPPLRARQIGKVAKTCDSSSSSSREMAESVERAAESTEVPPEYPRISRKLRTLDVFAGCGGLSEGLKQAGVVESKWAIESDKAAATAYSLNNPDAAVFTKDCNAILKKVMNGKTALGGQLLPQKGQVDLLCGGPPCQGFSRMNRFNSTAYSLFKNSLVITYLSYCDYYRPRFFVMENVRNFVTFKKGLVLKLTLRCLTRMGYQCTFGILQAGNFGVPQTRRRMILLAAAPGEILPKYPNPLHVFSKSACNLHVVVDDKKYLPAYDWTDSAPYKATTVWDALSDLPSINSGKSDDIMSYGTDPKSHFQRKIRRGIDDNSLRDHICKDFGALVQERINHIPTARGCDWRDLPNIVSRLRDGTLSDKLQYNYHDEKTGKSSTGALRGICSCATGEECDPLDRQDNTLIPWCLPHTANRHNNWAGLYGRIQWDGFFSTTTTNPEPMCKQGRVLHPEQSRVVSVRECARSQGLPDKFRIYGDLLNKHRQVGNAVPPPLAAAIGLEIRKCVSKKESKLK